MQLRYWSSIFLIVLVFALGACGGDPEPAVDEGIVAPATAVDDSAVEDATVAETPTVTPEATAEEVITDTPGADTPGADTPGVSDTAGITDTVVPTDTIDLTDTLVLTDSADVTGTMAVTDTAAVTGTGALTDSAAMTDTMGITGTSEMTSTSEETEGAGVVSAAGVTDTMGITDTAVMTDVMTDTVGMTDSTEMTNTQSITAVEEMTDTMNLTETGEITDTSAMSDTAAMGIQDADERLVRATDLQGYDVQNPEAESLGRVQDAVINLGNGQILLLTLEYGGFLDIGDKVFPIPLSAFRLEEETRTIAQPAAPIDPMASAPLTDTMTDTTATTDANSITGTAGILTDTLVLNTLLILDIPQENFENAPGFEDDFPILTEPATVGEIEDFYQSLGEEITGRAISETDLEAIEGTAVKLSDLLGSNVRNSAEENLGEIDDLLIRLSDGQVVYAVISFGGFLGIGENTYAIPLETFQIIPAVEEGSSPAVVLDVTEEQLESVPIFDEVDLNDFTWDEEVRSYWLTEQE